MKPNKESRLLARLADSDQVYIPTKLQELFHRDKSRGRLFLGANQSGKSRAGVNEFLYWLSGKHPYQQVPKKSFIWVVSQDYSQSESALSGHPGADDSFAEITKWLRKYPGLVKKINLQKKTLVTYNGALAQFKSAASEDEKFEAVKCHFIWFDEVPTKSVYDACMMRLISYDGHWIMTATPTRGTSCWTHKEFMLNRGDAKDEVVNYMGRKCYFYNSELDIALINPTVYDNRSALTGELNLPEVQIKIKEKTLNDATKKIRLYGEYATFEGLVFGDVWSPERHLVEPFEIPAHWKKGRGIDFGFSLEHPFACEFVAQDPNGSCYVYDEFTSSRRTIQENASAIKAKDSSYFYASIADKKGGDRIVELNRAGVEVAPGRSDPDARIDCITELFATDRLFIFKGKCPNLENNLNSFAWPKDNASRVTPSTKPRKLHDDSIDAMGEILLHFYFQAPPEEIIEVKAKTDYEREKERIHAFVKKEEERREAEREDRAGVLTFEEELCFFP